jgi:hypothetical protein
MARAQFAGPGPPECPESRAVARARPVLPGNRAGLVGARNAALAADIVEAVRRNGVFLMEAFAHRIRGLDGQRHRGLILGAA